MISDLDVARLSLAIYGGPSATTWDHFDDGIADGVCWALKRVGDVAVVVLRGSVTLRDWILDAQAMPISHDDLGWVHPGFYSGMRTVERELAPLLMAGVQVVVAGHSLGAARATILSALLAIDMAPPSRRVVFGEPLSGFAKLASILKDVPSASYRNGDGRNHDPVTDVPFALPPEFAYVRAGALTDVCAPPPASDSFGPFAFHHMALYVDGLTNLANGITGVIK